ncbi:DUF3558 domain-containing protein [Streptomyces sp. A3M-1-3]|uniref:DUF3558 family protein n=1 Tax=Streptomyces sp. A3M-1-3 TaxID=2962044 RepID=UPI0020B89E89|nr:DUF3558 family protein [Streptomyces sp. A3M-1-3]MCP3822116.1 DUF3558 domain-containing protein [Streptomyces sp. A3M-1-3]
MHRSAQRLTRILACAAVPVMLVVAGCSSDSGSGSDSGGKKGSDASSAAKSPSVKPSPTVEKAAFDKLPDPCKSVTQKTVNALVPEAKDKSGTKSKSNDIDSRGSCSWNGLEDDGLKGSQYRWLSVSLMRYDSDQALGSGNKRAEEQYAKQLAAANAAQGAKGLKTAAVSGVGDQATSVTYTMRKNVDFRNQTIVVRTQNVVLTLDYNGTSYEGGKVPVTAEMLKDAQKAAKEVVAAIAAANQR